MRSDAASGCRPMDVLDTGMLRWDATGHISAKPLRSANPAITSPAQAFSMGLPNRNTSTLLPSFSNSSSSRFDPNSPCSATVSHCFQCLCRNDAVLAPHLLSDIISLACSKTTFAWKVCTTTGRSTFGRPAETRSALATVADKGMVWQTTT